MDGLQLTFQDEYANAERKLRQANDQLDNNRRLKRAAAEQKPSDVNTSALRTAKRENWSGGSSRTRTRK